MIEASRFGRLLSFYPFCMGWRCGMETEWRDIPGYEGHYQVSNTGLVRSVKKEPLILKIDHQRNGYQRVYLWLGKGKKNCLVHRLVAEAFIPNPNHLPEVNHLDEDKDNNDIRNLEWCTHLRNLNYGTVKERIGNANRGRPVSDTLRQFFRKDTSRRRWINNGGAEKYVYLEDVEHWCAAGWKKGRLKRERSHTHDRKGEPIAC